MSIDVEDACLWSFKISDGRTLRCSLIKGHDSPHANAETAEEVIVPRWKWTIPHFVTSRLDLSGMDNWFPVLTLGFVMHKGTVIGFAVYFGGRSVGVMWRSRAMP